jgi:drug/metabolite transporter (DMT)-like permease
MLCGYVLLGLQPLPVRALAERGVSAPWVVVGRFAFSLAVIVLLCLLRRRGLRTGNPRVLLWRGIFGGVAVLLYFTAVQLAGVGPATVLNYTYPLWANVLAVLFLGQRVPRVFWLLLGLAIFGVWLIVDPGAAAAPPTGGVSATQGAAGAARMQWGRMAGLSSAVAAGAAVLCIKRLRETDESLTIITSFSVVGLVLALPVTWLARYAPEGVFGPAAQAGAAEAAWLPSLGPAAWLLLVAVGALAFGGHLFFTRGYKHTSVPVGTSLSLTTPVIAAAAGALLLREPLGVHFAAGTALVLAASGGITWLSSAGRHAPGQTK